MIYTVNMSSGDVPLLEDMEAYSKSTSRHLTKQKY